MVPWLWFLTRTTDCRIFQEKTVPDIIKQVFGDLGFTDIEDRLSSSYRTLTYCVQYRESAFNFVSRLMEQEGIYYFFLHDNGKHTLVLCDSLSLHTPYSPYEEVSYSRQGSAAYERVTEWTVEKVLHSGKYVHTDFNYQKPNTSLMSPESEIRSHSNAVYEIYDYPGEYVEKGEGEGYARVRMEELAQPYEICNGESDVRGICPGHLFTLEVGGSGDLTMANQARQYLVLSADYSASAQDYETSGGTEEIFSCNFKSMPSSVQYRPTRNTPKPAVDGAQTAIVTGPGGEDIYTDELGRVKVQFHWDREGKYDQNSSCWVRVSHAWAGAGWGAMSIPRIGQEVIIDFVEGDPDRPIITGRVYHGANKPPLSLPAQKTMTTIKSNSTLGGGGSNELRYEDKKGSEEIYLHGQKDWTIAIENDKNQTIGHDETMAVANNRDKSVGVDQSESIGSNKTIQVGKNHTETIGVNEILTVGADQTQTIGANKTVTVGGDQTESVGASMGLSVAATRTVQVGASEKKAVEGNLSENVGGKKAVSVGSSSTETVSKTKMLSVGVAYAVNVGGAMNTIVGLSHSEQAILARTIFAGQSITIQSNGTITIEAKEVEINGSKSVKINGKEVNIN
jgi:type VI secretion system secreted protein VgrG